MPTFNFTHHHTNTAVIDDHKHDLFEISQYKNGCIVHNTTKHFCIDSLLSITENHVSDYSHTYQRPNKTTKYFEQSSPWDSDFPSRTSSSDSVHVSNRAWSVKRQRQQHSARGAGPGTADALSTTPQPVQVHRQSSEGLRPKRIGLDAGDARKGAEGVRHIEA